MNGIRFEENIDRICRNDREGLRQIYEDYCPMIYSVVLDVLHNREDAEDITSEFFIRLWDIADTYKPGRGHRAWMITIARNMAADHLRKRSHECLTAELSEEALCSRLSLEQAMQTLKEEERQIVNLKIMGQLTFREIAAILKKPQGTVAWCYRTAISKLKEVRL